METDKHRFVSHIKPAGEGAWEERPLEDHLRQVGRRAGEFARIFQAEDWAGLAGRLHDLGKFRPDFQRYIRACNDLDAHIEGGRPGRVDHSTAGALYVERQLPKLGRILAYLIAGHHAGLPDWSTADSGNAALSARLRQGRARGYLADALSAPVPADILDVTAPTSKPRGDKEGFHLWVRMLFSCLVDADFLDTESFMEPGRGGARRGFPTIEELRTALDGHMAGLMRGAAGPVNELRAEIYRQCRVKAEYEPGLFSLTVPTGGGKTLASLAFALRHAQRHGKRRVIYAIPFTSIVEQTADVFREALGGHADVLVEHHSNAESEPEHENHRTRLACENWDAPLIVTTNVQLFESLFAARTSRCRKLHNLAGSVIVLDEAQTLPPDFLQPIVNVMRLLAEHYGVSFVFCTATQPELGSRKGFDSLFKGLDGIAEIMDDVPGLYRKLKRVEVELPADMNRPTEWPDLAGEIAALDRSVLCIVNRRDDCRVLYDLLRRRGEAPVHHLSALMCGQHRSRVIAEIRRLLREGEPIKVVSTQLVEAGVDLDFPVVYRALAGLDAIAQAAGRCNREGRLDRPGRVKVFVPPTEPPPGLLRQAAAKTRQILVGVVDDPLTPERFGQYFTQLYASAETDRHRIGELLEPQAGLAVSFRTAARTFHLIEDDSDTLFVKFAHGAELIDVLLSQGPERWLMRKLQRYAVGIRKRDMARLVADGQVEELYPGMFVQVTDTLYDERTGVRTTGDPPPNVLMV